MDGEKTAFPALVNNFKNLRLHVTAIIRHELMFKGLILKFFILIFKQLPPLRILVFIVGFYNLIYFSFHTGDGVSLCLIAAHFLQIRAPCHVSSISKRRTARR